MPRPEHIPATAKATSLQTRIERELGKFVDTLHRQMPDATHNIGSAISKAFVLDEIGRQIKHLSDKAHDSIPTTNTIEVKEKGLHTLARSPHFVYTLGISAPVSRFSDSALGDLLLKSKYKVPKHVTKDLVLKAKVPTTPRHTYKASEIEEDKEEEQDV